MDARYAALEDWTRKHFPSVTNVVYKWSGQIIEPVDHLGFMGRNPGDYSNVYIVTGGKKRFPFSLLRGIFHR
jgi:hypothetical protein